MEQPQLRDIFAGIAAEDRPGEGAIDFDDPAPGPTRIMRFEEIGAGFEQQLFHVAAPAKGGVVKFGLCKHDTRHVAIGEGSDYRGHRTLIPSMPGR
jgi:hypothetical protein